MIRIAIDGPAASGKGTVARGVAEALGYAHVDTGALYRAVGWLALRRGIALDDGPGLAAMVRSSSVRWVAGVGPEIGGERPGEALRGPSVGGAASAVARWPEVRAALLDLQRTLGVPGTVMDGRDVGTVIMPDAELKVFLDADAGERARRRHRELTDKGGRQSVEDVAAELGRRDGQDSQREAAPLAMASDAVHLDSTGMTPEEVVARVVGWAEERGG